MSECPALICWIVPPKPQPTSSSRCPLSTLPASSSTPFICSMAAM
jgi:hypothetical protein